MKIQIELITEEDKIELFQFEKENKAFFEKSVPPRPKSYFEFESFKSIFQELISEQEKRISLFYLIKNEVGEILGRINMVDIDWEQKSGNIGYRVGERFIGKGIAAKAFELLVNECNVSGIEEIVAKTTPANIPSQKVLEKCGFQKDYKEDEKFIYYKLAR